MLLFFVTARYRLPMIPVLAIFAALAIDNIASGTAKRSPRRLVVAAASFVMLLVIGRMDPLGYAGGSDAQGHQMMAALYEDQGDLTAAEDYYRLALKADPTLPHAHNDLGLLLLGQGEVEMATNHLELAAQYQHDEWLIQYNLGLAYTTGERWWEAVDQYRLVQQMVPQLNDATNDLARTWLMLGYADSALVQYRRLMKVIPDDYLLHFSTGLCHHVLEQRDSALWHYRQSLKLDPVYPRTHYNLALFWNEAAQPDSTRQYLQSFMTHGSGLPELSSNAQRLLDSLSSH